MAIVDNAVYVEGVRVADPPSLSETFEYMRAKKGMAWIGLYRPSEDELHQVAQEFGLHPLAVEDALLGHQRAKFERYGDILFIVLRPARYLDGPEEVEFGEVHLFIGPDFAITVRHAESPDLAAVRARLEASPDLLKLGPNAVLYAVLDQVVDEYSPVVHGLENDIDEIDDQLFGGESEVSRRIYELAREVMNFQRAIGPLVPMLDTLYLGFSKSEREIELRRGMRDVRDHAIKVSERADGFRTVLQNALITNSTLVTERQNEQMRELSETSITQGEQVKRISSYAAILFTPSLVTGVYGMNFTHMPELDWTLGYPLAVLLMIVLSGGLFLLFKRKGWL
ncbi:magnesium and cobalt transport protein CorA [Naasia lichenicola]|uniref:Magnesium and cobalt transport protein CorA n=1 Tax=Naasia lichenicola TaxID=2565933 RepID=A0A4V3WSM8_9MICO|nr:magnesium and cobalt transport protein CorA [Naasia lichenicola]THG28607.1 magnesium and cobalt transport protein CorA [Naasia lichenicola]